MRTHWWAVEWSFSGLHLTLTPQIEKSPFEIAAKRLEIDENVNMHIWYAIFWVWIYAMDNRTAFGKAPNEWTQIEYNMCGRPAAWSPLGWWPCNKTDTSCVDVYNVMPVLVANKTSNNCFSFITWHMLNIVKCCKLSGAVISAEWWFPVRQEFMVQLTQKQTTVGNVLHDGNCLLQQLQLSADERRCVDSQMSRLSNGWEELRVQAMDRQSMWVHCKSSSQR